MYCPPSRIWYGILYALIGVWPPRSSAAEAVITLPVEPGWNWACTARVVVWSTLVASDGLYVGYCALARTVPGLRLDDHDGAVVRLGLLDLGGARLLGRVLQRRDDGEPQAAAVHHRLVVAGRGRGLRG